MKKPTILLTGATGFIGSHIAKRLAHEGCNLKYLVRERSDLSKLPAHKSVQLCYGDLLDVFSLEAAMEDCQIVVHTAAKVSFLTKDAATMQSVNEQGTTNLVDAALKQGVRRLIHLSSVAALDRVSGKLTTLKDRWHETPAKTAYARTKFAAEREVWRGQAEGLEVAVLYPSTVIGEGDWLHSGTPRLFHRAKNGIRFTPRGTAGFVAIDDVVNAVVFALEQENDGVRILLSAKEYAWHDFLCRLAVAVDAKLPTIVLSKTASSIVWRLSTLVAKLTGKAPKISKDLHLTANAYYRYDGSSYEELTGHQYRSVDELINKVGAAYLKAFNSGLINH